MSNSKTSAPQTESTLSVGKAIILAGVIVLFAAVGYKAYTHTGETTGPAKEAAPAIESEKITG